MRLLNFSSFSFLLAIFTGFLPSKVAAQDESITISLNKLEPTLTNPEIYSKRLILPALNTISYVLTDVSPDIDFLIFQAHSFIVELTLSYAPKLVINNHINGTNLGLFSDLKTAPKFYISNFKSEYNADVYISVHAYRFGAPIPGGCNLEFNIETSPYLIMKEISPMIIVDAAPAKIPERDKCDNVSLKIDHVFYHFYFDEEIGMNKNYYFNAIKDMMDLDKIKQNSHRVSSEYGYKRMRRNFNLYSNTASIFVVTASFGNNTSIYVPVFSSGCNDPAACDTTTFAKLLVLLVGLCGLIMCFFGHIFFKITTFMFGALAGSLVAYVTANYLMILDFDVMLVGSLMVGIFFGIIWLIIWRTKGLPLLTISISLACVGCHVASIIYFACPDSIWFQIHENFFFWPLFGSISFMVVFFLLPFAHHANMKSCAFIGGFAMAIPLDLHFASHLRYIFFNIIRRLTVPGFDKVNIDPPFQMRDLLTTVIWGLLFAMGFISQWKLSRRKPPFPPPPRQRIVTSTNGTLPTAPIADENTPLLRNYFWNPQNDNIGQP